MKKRMSHHFSKRVAQRIGADVDAYRLFTNIVTSINNDDGFARFKSKLKGGTALYRFKYRGKQYAAIVNSTTNMPITIYSGKMMFWTKHGKLKRACGGPENG